MQAQKAHSLIGQVYDRRNLRQAWERVKRNKGAGGVDGVTIARFDENLDRYLDVLHQQLKDGRYRPRPVKRVEIDKPGTTKKRPLGIPTVMDRVCQQALVQVLEPISSRRSRRQASATARAVRRMARCDGSGGSWSRRSGLWTATSRTSSGRSRTSCWSTWSLTGWPTARC